MTNNETTIQEPTATPYPTLAEIVFLLKDHGVKVFNYAECGTADHLYKTHSIDFYGDFDDAMRVVSICKLAEVRIANLRKYWLFCDNEMLKPEWRIMVSATP